MAEVERMAETALKELDSQGRVSIPVKWRKGWKSRKLVMVNRKKKIEIIHIEGSATSLTDFFDSIQIPGDVDFADSHALKKKVLKLRLGGKS